MIDLTSILISIIAVAISILSVYYSKKQSDVMKRQSDTEEKSLELYQKELNSSNERFLTERKRNHYRMLIDESMQNWEYNPYLEGEMISLKITRKLMESNFAGQPIYPPPYLEQAKSHLKAYKEIWKLYEEAPSIRQKNNQQQQEFNDYLESKFKDEIHIKQIDIREPDIKLLTNRISFRILDGMDKEPEKKYSFSYMMSGTVVNFENNWIDIHTTDERKAKDLTNALNQLLKDTTAVNKAKAFLDTRKDIQQNKEQFEAFLMTEIIYKVRLSDYTNMKGQCNECLIFVTKEPSPK